MIRIKALNRSQPEFIEGIVDEVLAQGKEWRIRVHGIYWRAKTQGTMNFSPGQHVKILGRTNMKLVIAPL